MIEEWFKWWNAGTSMCAHVTNVTSDYAAVNVAGPYARQTLTKLTDIDMSSQGVPLHAFRARRDCGHTRYVAAHRLRWRSGDGRYTSLRNTASTLWEAIIERGPRVRHRSFRAGGATRPAFGKETHHRRPGHRRRVPTRWKATWNGRSASTRKTSSAGPVSSPFVTGDCATSWSASSCRTGRYLTTGFRWSPGRAPIGRVTSARRSPTTGKGFGLAWVPVEMAEEGGQISGADRWATSAPPKSRCAPSTTPTASDCEGSHVVVHPRQEKRVPPQAIGYRSATWSSGDGWLQPSLYSSVDQESRLLNEGAVVCDISPIGKLLLQGDDLD